MSRLRAIRKLLKATQAEIGEAIGCSQSNVGYIERGQVLKPDAARALIEFAASRGVLLSFDHVYGDRALPPPARLVPAESLEA